ncbi:MAG TPA: type II toxin-antitoxin system VapC family toxin [Spirochaetota bacterium]|nr:type II toxin-antitoxin system VapC family toxin [Spirochaetota bacterium]HPI90172.1 type II toxin-antitoxin system VapC family toxin [Spirochaetota bacterium]HPR49611.1 type II toxin-antitoxin system VapC family toxin [Spirochaetota bacterium]
MKSVDTNIIIRFLVNDDKKQGQLVKKLFEDTEKRGGSLLISVPVLLEVLYVLKSVYGFKREDILMALESLITLPILIFEKTDVVQNFISAGKDIHLELDDLFIAMISRDSGCETTITFDKKAARSSLFELLQ